MEGLVEAQNTDPAGMQRLRQRVRQPLGTPLHGWDTGDVLGPVSPGHTRGQQDREQGALLRVQTRLCELTELLNQPRGGICVDTSSVAQ